VSGRHSHPDRRSGGSDGAETRSTVLGPASPADTVVGSGGRVRRTLQRLRRWRWKRIIGLGVPGFLLLLTAAFLVTYARTDIPEPNEFTQKQSVTLRYSDGSEIGRLGTNRRLVSLDEVSEPAQKAVLSAEDRGFYTEPGISPKGIARALLTNVKGGGTQQGGSTITQQYAKNAFLTQERTYKRKVKEVFISLKMTRQRSKEQILEDYLNTIYFGRGAYGIEAASQAYFGVPAVKLSVQQGAVLAASIQSPSLLDPKKNPTRAKERYRYVLDGMLDKQWITVATHTAAVKTYPPVLAIKTVTNTLAGPEGTVVRAALNELKASGRFTAEDIERGGLDITTTIDRKAQAAAVEAVQKVTGKDRGGKGLQGALVAVEPGTGRIKAYYGGANGQGIDYAATPNQPGSSMKAYTLATALKQGISLDTKFDGSSPQYFGKTKIRNFGRGVGQVDLVTMTKNSTNTAFYALAKEVGPDEIADTAYAAGISKKNTLKDASGTRTEQITLGAYPIRPVDQAAGFATFAARGKSATPFLVAKVRTGGETVYTGKSTLGEAFSKDVADDATYAMQQVVEDGSGTRARLDGGRPAAGKTGTTSGNKSIWFAGYTPQLAAAVWFGYGTPKKIEIDGVGEATGGRIASAAWADFMNPVMEGREKGQFAPRAFVGGTPTPTATPSRSATPTPTPSLTPSATPTPTATPTTPRPTLSPPTVTLFPLPTTTSAAPPTTTPTSDPPSASIAPSASGGAVPGGLRGQRP
jgi:membrane peptidoglycan carboxypeptidase